MLKDMQKTFEIFKLYLHTYIKRESNLINDNE
jgi:hypothetical protein